MHREELERRRKVLRDLDVALLMQHVIVRIGQLLEGGQADFAEDTITGLERAFGVGVASLADRLQALEGVPGDRARRAAFARAQSWRRRPMEQLQYVALARSRQGADRWAWVARSYRRDLEQYLECTDALANQRRVTTLNEQVSDAGVRDEPVFRAIVDSHARLVRRAANADPKVVAHVLDRVDALAVEGHRVRERRVAALAERDRWRERVVDRLTPALEAQIGQLRTVASQIEAYTRAQREWDWENESRQTADRLSSVINGLSALDALLGDWQSQLVQVARQRQPESELRRQHAPSAEPAPTAGAPEPARDEASLAPSPVMQVPATKRKKSATTPRQPAPELDSHAPGKAGSRSRARRDVAAEQRYRRGVGMVELGLYEEALREFEAVCIEYPSDAAALIAMALMLERIGRREEAIGVAARAAQKVPNDRFARIAYDCLKPDMYRLDDAAAELRELRALGEVEPVVNQLLTALVARARRWATG